MDAVAQALLVIGGLMIVGTLSDALAQRLPLPRVTLLVVLGAAAGPAVLDVLPPAHEDWFPIASTIALVMIGFLVGGELTRERIAEHGRSIISIAVVQALATAGVVAAGLLALGVEVQVALPLAGIAAATAPASTVAVVQEHGRDGWLSRMIVGVVALDDVLTIVLFSVLVAVASVTSGAGLDAGLLAEVAWDVVGAVLLGAVVGAATAAVTGRMRPGEPTREEALGAVLVIAGLAIWLDVSFLLAAVTAGAVVANVATHHERPFREIEGIEWPFLVVFFILAGAELRFDELAAAGALAAAYVLLRVLGKVSGAALAVRLVNGPPEGVRWLGPALLPQAGVALGLALLASDRFSQAGERLVAVVVVSTVLFEIVGAALTRAALTRADEPAKEG